MVTETAVTGGVLAGVLALFKVVEAIIAKMSPNSPLAPGGPQNQVAQVLGDHLTYLRGRADQMHEIVSLKDGDGLPLIYTPRRNTELLEEIRDLLINLNGKG